MQSLGFARRTVKRWLRKAKLQPFNKTLSGMAALIKENSSLTVQRVKLLEPVGFRRLR